MLKSVHQLLDELEILQTELQRQILDDDGRLNVNDFLRPPSASAGAGAESGASASAAGVTGGAGAVGWAIGPAGASGVARIREMGGKIARLVASTPAGRFRRGFFSSINDTVSMAGFFAGLGASSAFGRGADGGRTLGSSAVEAGRGAFAGASTLALLASGRFGSGAALAGAADLAAALTGLRAVAGLRAAVLVVVFVGICLVKNCHGWPISGKPVYCAAGLS